jgi:hypothetical protein
MVKDFIPIRMGFGGATHKVSSFTSGEGDGGYWKWVAALDVHEAADRTWAGEERREVP